LSEGRHGQNPNLKEDASMKNMFWGSKGNGVTTTNRCMGCTRDCESCIFKDVADQFRRTAEKGEPTVNKLENDFDKQGGLFEEDIIHPSSEDFSLGDAELFMMHHFNKIFDIDEENEEQIQEAQVPILCKPYLVTIKAIYHEYYGNTDHIIVRLAIDEKGNVIKEPWSPQGSNPDSRLDSLAFGAALHHITDTIRGTWVFAEDALEFCINDESDEGEDESETCEIIYPVGPNFMTKTVTVDSKAILETVRLMESSQPEKKWIMAVFEVVDRNLLNDTEYFIGLPRCDSMDKEI
jgi:hypothetical protein